MIKKRYTGSARRARNIIWNAAGRYDFDPPFMAFFPNGAPDDYFNMIAGLAVKWLDMDRLWAFFERYGNARRAAEFDEFLWLGLENCLYEKEIGERPILASLRKERAERFYREQQSLSRQQMEYQSMPVYTQQEARWAPICGHRPPLLGPREKRMAEALRFPGELDTDGVLARMEEFLVTFFRFTPADVRPPRPAGFAARLLFRREHRRQDRLIVRTGTGEGNHPRAVQQRHDGLGRYVGPSEADEAYIRAVFGRSLYPERELRLLENELCTGADADCRLWITRGNDAGDASDADAADVRAAARQQQERSEAFLKEHAAEIRRSIRDLSVRIETVLSSYLKRLPEPARAGQLRPEAAYRLPVLSDERVFRKGGEETETELCVDILLDASQSRMHLQETLAAEAYIIAESLVRLRIPVRVCTFRSLRGFTVLQILKDWRQHDCRGIARYFAAGWNRDGLALKAAGRLDDDPALEGKRRMLLILTDASPNDSAPLAGEGLLLPREYEGSAAVRATEQAVRALRTGGLRVGAVFHGSTSHMADLQQIYGHAYVRIRKVTQLAQGVSDLLLLLLREMRRD